MADNNKATSLDNVKQYVKGVLQGWFSNKATLDKLSTATNGDLLYNGNPVGSGSSVTVDAALSATSENPVQNKAIYSALQNISGGTPAIVDSELSSTSENPVQNKVIKAALDGKADVSAIPDVTGFVLSSSLAAVATSGDYSDLTNTPAPYDDTALQNSVSQLQTAVANVYTKTEVDDLISSSACDDTPMSEVEAILESIFGSGGSSGVKIVSFSNGTDSEIADMLAAHYAGEINIHDFWRVGDTRTVSLGAMAAWGSNGESHASQTVEIVLVNAGGYTTSDNKECAFVWQQKDGLIEPGYMNATATNNNGWSGSARRSWASVYKQALPGYFKGLMKTCTIRTARENQAGTLYVDSQDELFLPSMTEVYGTITDQNSVVWTDGYEGNQWDYYKTEVNIYDKKMGTIENAGNTRLFYWLRSPDRSNTNSFMRVPIYRGTPKGSQANTVTTSTSQYTYHYMIVPCGFI